MELLTSCESFELRVSLLEQNCEEKFRELFTLIDDIQQQQEDNSKIEQNHEGTAAGQAWEGSAVPPPPLGPGVPLPLFTQPPPSFTQNQLSILMQEGKLPLSTDNSEPAATAPTLAPSQIQAIPQPPSSQHIQRQWSHGREWSPYMNSSGKMEVGPIMDYHGPGGGDFIHTCPPFNVDSSPDLVIPSSISTPELLTNNNNPSTRKMKEPVIFKAIDIIPDDKYSLLVGQEGETIDAIREESGATVTITEKTDKPPSKYFEVSYSGSFSCVSLAREMVDNIVK